MKYMGSKNRLSKELVPIIQKYIDDNRIENYLEPFVGGCSIIEKIKCKNRYGSDNHKYLIALLNNLNKLNELPDFVTKEHYSDVRNCYNKKLKTYEDWYIGAIGFLASYNGRFFDGGYAGIVRTKIGTERNYYKEAYNNLINQSDKLKNIVFNYCDFRNIKPIKNFIIYCDPPYKNTKQYSTSKNFPYEEFYKWCKEMSEDNIVLISEYDMPDDFECIWSKETKTSMDNNRNANDEKNKRIEKLFIYRGEYLNGRQTSKV